MSDFLNSSLEYYVAEEGPRFTTHVSLQQIIDTFPWNTTIILPPPESSLQEDTVQLIQPIPILFQSQETSSLQQQQTQISESIEYDNKENVTGQEKKIRIMEFTCTYCNKVYRGKNARSILRRHLKTKHNINPPRGTRWDNDPNRPKTDEERRLREIINSQFKVWAQKSRTKKSLEKSSSSTYKKQERFGEILNSDNSSNLDNHQIDTNLPFPGFVKQEGIYVMPYQDINSNLGGSHHAEDDTDDSEYIKQECIDNYEVPNQVNFVEEIPNQVLNLEDMNLLYDAGPIKSTLLWLGVTAESDAACMDYSDNQRQNNFLIKEEFE
ncbi:17263_t:CDS:2 [Funneliformis geosporum]|uniref:7539_t:CDS:1 n=1 Tax=Funneliformis geosporum TaxID=1117311 RepID=A0A9W4SAC0_9GLOM|nr:7539_t:CDS:2 [Funneliformis geosporum]CAI2161656.1 17263_t:CDS:2 [Funneliformis geosporum]